MELEVFLNFNTSLIGRISGAKLVFFDDMNKKSAKKAVILRPKKKNHGN
jgi:hypothetical protein